MEKCKLVFISEYVDSDGKKYNVYVNLEELCILNNEIRDKLAYEVSGEYWLTRDDEVKKAFDQMEKSGDNEPVYTFDYVDGPLYRNITNTFVINTGCGKIINFYGGRVVFPRLVRIISDIFTYSNEKSIAAFLDYLNQDEVVSIDEKIDTINKRLNGVKSELYTDSDVKLLADLYLKKANGYYFNVELLKEYYAKARSMFVFRELELDKNEEKNVGSKVLS